MKQNEEESVNIAIVLGYIAVKDLGTIEKKVSVLNALGYSNADMAKICGSSAGVIRTIKYNISKGGQKK